jgi:superfamily II DNA helicase RecQ
MYTKFTQAAHAVLFATDGAARGLDFRRVDWVLQVDTPEDAKTYVHRVGRTARYESKGKALMFLLPSDEEGMKVALACKGVEVRRIKAKMSKVQSIENQLQNLCFQDPEIKYLGQRVRVCVFLSYLGFCVEPDSRVGRHSCRTCARYTYTRTRRSSTLPSSRRSGFQSHWGYLGCRKSSS